MQSIKPGVYFSYDFRSATFIEIALSNVAIRRRPTFALQKAAKKVGERRTSSTFTIEKSTPGFSPITPPSLFFQVAISLNDQ